MRTQLRRSLMVVAIVVLGAGGWLLTLRLGLPSAFSPELPQNASNVRLQTTWGVPAALYDARRSTLVFFGYTRCADACPRTLAILSRAVQELDVERRPRIAFVDIDPWRDDPAAVQRYARRFPGVDGLCGDEPATIAAQRALGARQVLQRNDVVNHDARVFVVDARGILLGTIAANADVDQVRTALRSLPGRTGNG